MDLNFTKQGNDYVAEFEVAGDFNLHLERQTMSPLNVEQRTSASGEYAVIKGMDDYSYDKVIDLDFIGGVYPKYIRISCVTMPTMAIVTTAE